VGRARKKGETRERHYTLGRRRPLNHRGQNDKDGWSAAKKENRGMGGSGEIPGSYRCLLLLKPEGTGYWGRCGKGRRGDVGKGKGKGSVKL